MTDNFPIYPIQIQGIGVLDVNFNFSIKTFSIICFDLPKILVPKFFNFLYCFRTILSRDGKLIYQMSFSV